MAKFQLKTTNSEYILEDESGYSFRVNTAHDPECGWSASVSFASYGMRGEDAAIDKLTQAVERFLRMACMADDVATTTPMPAGEGGE